MLLFFNKSNFNVGNFILSLERDLFHFDGTAFFKFKYFPRAAISKLFLCSEFN